MHSWRVLLLPYLECKALYARYDFDEPWNAPKNRRLAKFIPDCFRCPMDTGGDPTMTSYLAVVGPEAAWRGAQPHGIRDFKDGSSCTITIVEVTDSGVNWMEPCDISLDEAGAGVNTASGKGIRSPHRWAGASAGFAHGGAEVLPPDIPPKLLRGLLTIDGGEDVREFFAN